MSAENKDLVRCLVLGWQHEHRSARPGEQGTRADDPTRRDGAMSQRVASAPS